MLPETIKEICPNLDSSNSFKNSVDSKESRNLKALISSRFEKIRLLSVNIFTIEIHPKILLKT